MRDVTSRTTIAVKGVVSDFRAGTVFLQESGPLELPSQDIQQLNKLYNVTQCFIVSDLALETDNRQMLSESGVPGSLPLTIVRGRNFCAVATPLDETDKLTFRQQKF